MATHTGETQAYTQCHVQAILFLTLQISNPYSNITLHALNYDEENGVCDIFLDLFMN